jgi:hypothetical protein
MRYNSEFSELFKFAVDLSEIVVNADGKSDDAKVSDEN